MTRRKLLQLFFFTYEQGLANELRNKIRKTNLNQTKKKSIFLFAKKLKKAKEQINI